MNKLNLEEICTINRALFQVELKTKAPDRDDLKRLMLGVGCISMIGKVLNTYPDYEETKVFANVMDLINNVISDNIDDVLKYIKSFRKYFGNKYPENKLIKIDGPLAMDDYDTDVLLPEIFAGIQLSI